MSSKEQEEIQIGKDIFKKDVDVKKKLLTGVHVVKNTDEIEANFQIAFWKKERKKYDKVANALPIEEQPKLEIEKRIS